MRGKHELFRVVGALHHPGGFPRGLNRGEKQGDEYADNSDHDEKLNEGKALARARIRVSTHENLPEIKQQGRRDVVTEKNS